MEKGSGFQPVADELGLVPVRQYSFDEVGGLGGQITMWQHLQDRSHGIVPVTITEYDRGRAAYSTTSFDTPLYRVDATPDGKHESKFWLDLLQMNHDMNFFGVGNNMSDEAGTHIEMAYSMVSEMPTDTHRHILNLAGHAHGYAADRVVRSALKHGVVLSRDFETKQ